ncbi:12577_t:CDS:2 [Entrophospora sp. SA101]|nr:12574_t:CDS:2 [Entrophospora sp. SA101]CAJ0647394.1 12577_t:CDS:2 [Entrophospora sp. SA101]
MPYPSKCKSQLKDPRTQIEKKSDDELLFNDVIIISSSSSNNTNDIPSSSLNEPDIMPVFDVVSTANDINNEYSLPTLEHKIKNEKELDPRLQYTAQYLRLVNSGYKKMDASNIIAQSLNRGTWCARLIRTWGKQYSKNGELIASKQDLLPGQQIPKEACVIIHPGANNEGYWNCDKMAKQLKEKAIPIFEAMYPGC